MCRNGRGGTSGTRKHSKAPASRELSVRTRRYQRSYRKRTTTACPTTTSSPPKPYPVRRRYPQSEGGNQRQGKYHQRASTREEEMTMMITKEGFIAPHGGRLVDRKVPAEERDERLREAEELTKVPLEPRALSDLQMISTGVFSPVEGFMLQDDYIHVVEEMHLSNGLAWSMPITLAVEEEVANSLKEDSMVALVNGDG